VTRDELLGEVWKQPFGGSNLVDVMVRGLRRKLGGNVWAIGTVKGHGYHYKRHRIVTAAFGQSLADRPKVAAW